VRNSLAATEFQYTFYTPATLDVHGGRSQRDVRWRWDHAESDQDSAAAPLASAWHLTCTPIPSISYGPISDGESHAAISKDPGGGSWPATRMLWKTSKIVPGDPMSAFCHFTAALPSKAAVNCDVRSRPLLTLNGHRTR
jgi:hypothetical protein